MIFPGSWVKHNMNEREIKKLNLIIVQYDISLMLIIINTNNF